MIHMQPDHGLDHLQTERRTTMRRGALCATTTRLHDDLRIGPRGVIAVPGDAPIGGRP